MPEIKFIGQCHEGDILIGEKGKIPPVRYKKSYRESLGKFFKKLFEFQKSKLQKLIDAEAIYTDDDWLRDLEISIKWWYRKRTLDQNKLLWALYEIEANEHNAGISGHASQNVTAEELYENDVNDFAETDMVITTRKNFVSYYEQHNRIVCIKMPEIDKKLIIRDPADIRKFLKVDVPADFKIGIQYIRSTSDFNTVEMTKWIDRIFNRLALNGTNVTEPADIEVYWKKFKQELNDQKVLLNDEILTQQEYKERTPRCEASGDPLPTGGELAHIKAVGMGMDRTKEPARNYASNWLHLRSDIHRGIQHQKGWKKFLEEFPWLKFKVESALKKEYKPIPADETEYQKIVQQNEKEMLDELELF